MWNPIRSRVATFAAASLFVMTARPAEAQHRATTDPIGTDVLPSIAIAGSASDEKATFELGASWQHGIDNEFAIIVLPSFSVATAKGLANVLSWRVANDAEEAQESTPWTLQTSLALLRLTLAQNPLTDAASQAYEEQKTASAIACVESCASRPNSKFCQPLFDAIAIPTEQDLCPQVRGDFAEAKRMAAASPGPATRKALLDVLLTAVQTCRDDNDNTGWKKRYEDMFLDDSSKKTFVLGQYAFPEELNRSQLCPAAQQKLKRIEPVASEHPRSRVSIGGSVGGAAFENLRKLSDSPLQYATADEHQYQYKAGIAVTHVFAPAPAYSATLEARTAFVSEHIAQTKKGRWCEAAGEVIPDPDTGTSYPLESCRELALGDPTHKEYVDLAFQLGLIDQRDQLWRAAIGPEARLKTGGSGQEVMRFGVSAPFYFNVGSVFFPAAKYKGIVRVSPGVSWDENEKGEKGRTYSISLALMGDRYFFSSKFDEF